MASKDFKINLNALNPDDIVLTLIEIYHPKIVGGIYLVNDLEEVTSGGNTYIPINVRVQMQSDIENQLPKITMAVSNVSKDLLYWIQQSRGAKGAEVVFKLIRKSSPEIIERRYKTKLIGLNYNAIAISFDLVIQDTLNKAGVLFSYTKTRVPNLF